MLREPGSGKNGGMIQPSPAKTAVAKQAGILNGAVVAVMWVLETIDVVLRGALNWFGVHAWDFSTIWTMVTAPFAHSGFSHLAANSVPLLVLGFVIALGGIKQWAWVTLAAAFGSGLFAFVLNTPGTVTIGASGIVFGYLTYLLIRGIFSADWKQIVIGLVVFAVYGTVLWGVFPSDPGISWQGHLGGAVAGVVVAWWLHSRAKKK